MKCQIFIRTCRVHHTSGINVAACSWKLSCCDITLVVVSAVLFLYITKTCPCNIQRFFFLL